MMIDLCNRLVDNKLTKNDLLERVEIRKTTPNDLENICDTLSRAFDMYSPEEAYLQPLHSLKYQRTNALYRHSDADKESNKET